MAVVFARRLFLIAGLAGLGLLVPMYLLEDFLGRNDPPAITHPEFFYGFIGVALACQVLFLVIATDPLRYRLAIIPAILEKFGYGVAVLVLFSHGRVSSVPVATAAVDLVLGVLFIVAFVSLRRASSLD